MVRGVRIVAVLVVFLFVIFQAVFILYETAQFQSHIQTRAVEGIVTFCINYPPSITDVCPSDINQSTAIENNTLYCQMNATTISNTSLNFSSEGEFNGTTLRYNPINFILNGLSFSINSSGFVTIYANQSGVGSYYVPIKVQDTSACPLSDSYDYEFVIHDINDPPTLIRNLPSKSMPMKSTIVPFALANYFRDLDGDNMTYSYSTNSSLIIVISNTSQVSITAPEAVCERQTIYFTATDEHNLSTDSNIVTVDVICTTSNPESSSSGGGGSACESEWICKDWSRCFINNSRYRSCTDIHACDLSNIKSEFWEECVYVQSCYDGIQNQGEVGIDCGGPCPSCPVEKKKEELNETCEDGIKNQGELGIDCGGPCSACKQVEVPGLLPEEYSNNFLTIAMIIILILGAIVVVYIIFRKEIKSFLAKIGWWLTRKKRKQILLRDEDREELLDAIKEIELRAKKLNDTITSANKLFQDYLKISKLYFEKALGLQAFSEEEIDVSIKKIKNGNLGKALKIFIERHMEFEKSSVAIDKGLMLYYIQDLRQLVLNTSHYDKKDYSFIARAIPIRDGDIAIEKGKTLLYNATVALEFANVDAAKDSYFELLKVYELLDDAGKEVIFDELTKLFNYIKYEISWQSFGK